jgi:hypothetical protein
MPAPVSANLPSGLRLDLHELAQLTCSVYDAEFPDERERYGPAGREWCIHDNCHLLNWAVLSLSTPLDFDEQVAWLARVLESRDFPLDRLARGLDLLAETVAVTHPRELELIARLHHGATFVRGRRTFL